MFTKPYTPKYQHSNTLYAAAKPTDVAVAKNDLLCYLAPGMTQEEEKTFLALPYDMMRALYPMEVKWHSFQGEEIETVYTSCLKWILEVDEVGPLTLEQQKAWSDAVTNAFISLDEVKHPKTLSNLMRGPKSSTMRGTRLLTARKMYEDAIKKISDIASYNHRSEQHMRLMSALTAGHMLALYTRDRVGQKGSPFTQKNYDDLVSLNTQTGVLKGMVK